MNHSDRLALRDVLNEKVTWFADVGACHTCGLILIRRLGYAHACTRQEVSAMVARATHADCPQWLYGCILALRATA